MRSRLALAWVAGFLAGGCGLLIGLEDRELPDVGPDATADVFTPDGTRPDTGPNPDLDGGPDVKVDAPAQVSEAGALWQLHQVPCQPA